MRDQSHGEIESFDDRLAHVQISYRRNRICKPANTVPALVTRYVSGIDSA